jgi:acyl-coenzyme A synthetase/AMP-(fatty) acid ligase
VPPAAFDGDWYRTGDLAKLGEHGMLEVLGRCDLSINRNGVLLPFADVENRLREIDGVAETAVAAGTDSIRGHSLIAFIVLARGHMATERELRAKYGQHAPAYAVLDEVRIIEVLPKLPSGKIDRRALAALALQKAIVQN